MEKYLLSILGSSIDSFYQADSYPEQGDFSHARFISKNVGGCCLNVAGIVSSKNVPVKVLDMLSKQQDSSDYLLSKMQELNLDTSLIVKEDDITNGEVVIIVTGEKRTMFVVDPQRKYYQVDQKMQDCLNNATYIYSMMHVINRSFANIEPLLEAKRHGAKVILDGCSKYDDPSRLSILYDLADGMFINTEDYARLKQASPTDPIETILKNGEFVIITDGSKGATLHTKEKNYFAQGVKGVKVVDSTGAGDSFAGAFLASLLKDYDYQYALKLATLSGGYACTGTGGMYAAVDEETLLKFGREHDYDL